MPSRKSCPPNTLCLDTTTVTLLVLVVVAVVVIVGLCVYIAWRASPVKRKRRKHVRREVDDEDDAPPPAPPAHRTPSPPPVRHPSNTPRTFQQQPPNVTTNIYQQTNYEDPMLRPPLRQSPDTVQVGLMPINIETRGATPEMQQVGILRSDSNDTILALYGRPTYRGSSKWLYYTGTDKFHSVKLPVEKNQRDCTSEYGCDELYDDEEVKVKGYSGAFKTTIYGLDAPRYIPYVV